VCCFPGKSSLLAKFSDRTSADNLPSSAASNSVSSVPSLLANGAASGGGGEHALDYSYCAVKNRQAAPGAGDKDEVLARMHLWQLDEPQHAPLIASFLQSSRPASATAPPAAASSASGVSTAAPVLDYAALDRACFVIAVDLSEPWRAVDSVREWLAALSRVLTPALAALPEAQAQALRTKVSRYIQSYYSPSVGDEAADGADSLVSPHSGGGAATSSPTAAGSAPLSSSSPALESGPPVDPAVPEKNLGVPIIIAGLKADAFGRHYHSGRSAGSSSSSSSSSSSGGSSSTGRGALDEKFDFLARKLRRLCLQWGATLIYTSVGGGGGASSSSRSSSKDAGVNVELLQHYILHRLYRFPLNPAAGAATAAAAAVAGATSPDAAAGKSGGGAFAAAAAAAAAAKRAAQFQPRVLGSVEDDFGFYVPAGYDSAALLDTSASSGLSAAFSDATSLDEVLPNPYAGAAAAAAAAAARSSKRASGGATSSRVDTVQAEDNTVFFKNLKYQLEVGGSGVGLALAPASTVTQQAPSASAAPAHTRTATGAGLPAASSVASAGGSASTATAVGESKAAATSSGAAAAPATGTAGGAQPVKGQIAVKQFFRSLLNNPSGKPDGSSSGKTAAAQKAVVRANAEQELKRMTNTGDAAAAPQQQQQPPQ
jgi:uncharacterized membrane protein YgcG